MGLEQEAKMSKEAIELQKEVVKFLNTISELMFSNDFAVVRDLKVAKRRAKAVLALLEKQPEQPKAAEFEKQEYEINLYKGAVGEDRRKLEAEIKRLQKALGYAKKKTLALSLQIENTSEKGFALAEGINNKINSLGQTLNNKLNTNGKDSNNEQLT